MQEASTFQIYNASAGSGKTFTLVKEYLKILLSSEDIFTFQKVLAITFTNKAAAEMKDRVLKNLKAFADGDRNSLSELLLAETTIDRSTLQKRSDKVLNAILQNYSAFYITTIDSFTYKIVKSFAFDLGLTQNFEVEMDVKELLNEAVDLLISRIGSDKNLTDVLINYSLEKTDDDKSWNISHDLVEFSKILLNESDAKYFKRLSSKSLDDFKQLKQKLLISQKETESKMKQIGEDGLTLIESQGIDSKDFYRSMLPNHFVNLSKDPSKAKFFDKSALKANIESGNFYAKSKAPEIIESIESVLPRLLSLYEESESLYKDLVLNNLVLGSIVPLTVLNNINQELSTIKEENNIRLNSEFNQLISENIQEQPAPYIYERIGQKFMHYFIDEMQDTSVLQWENLIPLIDNSLSQENTSLLLVGDGKQAIYRWRGGKAEQFIGLGSKGNSSENPFLTEKDVKELETNYRSYGEIIQFNNSLFQHVSGFIQNPSYKELYAERSFQKTNDKEGGFVSVSFLDKEEDKPANEIRDAKKILGIIQNLDEEWDRGDICILVRRKKEGVAIANYLSEHNVDIVSSETLLLSNSEKVNFIIAFMRYSLFSNDKQGLFDWLSYVYDSFDIQDSKNTFYQDHIHLPTLELFEALKQVGIQFDLIQFHQLPLYEKIEQIIRSFDLLSKPDAYVQFFLDEVLTQQRKEASVQDLLDYWELKKEALSVVSSENKDAVKIMTIHKSKGLEFPVVIFPCELNIYREIDAKAWLQPKNDFPEVLVRLNKQISHVSAQGEAIYNTRQEELELDNFNLLYVALTRAVEQLHIITDKKLNAKGVEDPKYFSGIFISYLKKEGLWSEDQDYYSFGSEKRTSKKDSKEVKDYSLSKFLSTPWQDHNINMLASSSKLWGTIRGQAINFGDLIHEMMSEIVTSDDVEEVLKKYIQKGDLDVKYEKDIKEMMNSIVGHEQLKPYFSNQYEIYNEREIISEDGQIYIPDRLAIDNNNTAVIIDYKTGIPNSKHRHQLNAYTEVLESIGYQVEKKILVYLNNTIALEEF